MKKTTVFGLILILMIGVGLTVSCEGPAGASALAPEITIGENGNWWINGVDTGESARGSTGTGQTGEPGTSPRIGPNGNWWIGDTDTTVSAVVLPEIGQNGNWWIGANDTGVKAQGAQGAQGVPGEIGSVLEIGTNGNWWIDGEDTTIPAKGDDGDSGLTPFIGANGNWWIGLSDTNVKAEGPPGTPGVPGDSPYIGTNGNWWIGPESDPSNDTGIAAQGVSGLTPFIGPNGNWWIGTDDTGEAAGAAGLTPFIGPNGNWWIGTNDTSVAAGGADGNDGLTPFIGANGNWWIGTNDTSVAAEGAPGTPGAVGASGVTPHIGVNGNWWIGPESDPSNDTGIAAQGVPGASGETPHIGANGNWWIGTNDTGIAAEGTPGAPGASGETPYIGANGNWWIGPSTEPSNDTGIQAQGPAGATGASGDTPFIGDNGNWWIGTTDTGVAAMPVINMIVGQSIRINLPYTSGSTQTITWASSDPDIVTVDATGRIIAVGVDEYWMNQQHLTTGVNAIGNAVGTAIVTASGSFEGNYLIKTSINPVENIENLPSLHESFAPYIDQFGTVIGSQWIYTASGGSTFTNFGRRVQRHFNIVTPENNHKPTYYSPNTYTAATQTVNIGFTGNQNRGIAEADSLNIPYLLHAISWHEQRPNWWGTDIARNSTGATSQNNRNIHRVPMARAQALDALEQWVDKIIDQHANRVYAYDVVNESILGYPEEITQDVIDEWFNFTTTNRGSTGGTPNAHSFYIGSDYAPWNVTEATKTTLSPVHPWGHADFTWRDALRRGRTEEEVRERKVQGCAWVMAIGPDFMYYVYKFTRLALIRNGDLNAVLYQNDYDTYLPNKHMLIAQMVKDINDRWDVDPDNPDFGLAPALQRPLINGLGIQEHNNLELTTKARIQSNFDAYRAIMRPGMHISATEVDVRIYDAGSNTTTPTVRQQLAQARLYYDMFTVYLENSDIFKRVTLWGLGDSSSWMASGNRAPMLFTGSNDGAVGTVRGKPAYYYIMTALEQYKESLP